MRTDARQWILRGEPFQMNGNSSADGFPAILGHLIEQRGLPAGDQLESFLHPRLRDIGDPFEIVDMQPAVERVLQAVDAGEQVCIFGDYDVDGVTSVAVMRRMLEAYGLEPRHFIPRRSSEGYGLSEAALKRCVSEGPRPDLLIAVDCGTVSVDEIATIKTLGRLRKGFRRKGFLNVGFKTDYNVAAAEEIRVLRRVERARSSRRLTHREISLIKRKGFRRRGVDVIVVDHHESGPRGRPDVVALVNPKCGGGPEYLCAAGVCFKLCHALLKTRAIKDFDLKSLLEFVTLATVADIVPMVGENRLMVRHGLKRLPNTLNPGLQALQKLAGMNGRVTSMDIGFRIGPRLNAAGRMDVPEDALEILLTDCRREADQLAERLEEYNRRRQQHEAKIRKEALEMLEQRDPDEPVIVLGSREWHPGVVGIVASRLMRQFHRPTFIVAIDENGVGKGSGRSVEGVSLVEAIHEARDHLVAGGGHDMAAGISVKESKMDAFRESFSRYVFEQTDPDARLPRLYLDAEIPLDQLSLEFLKDYELLQPFGNGNPQPVFMARKVELSRSPQRLKNEHMRFTLRHGFHERDAIFFGAGGIDFGEGEKGKLPAPPWDIAFTIDRNQFRGRTSLQIVIQDLRAAEIESKEVRPCG